MQIADTGDKLILSSDTRELAYLHYLADSDGVEIQYLYTDDPHLGYGTQLVTALKTKYPNATIQGVCRPSVSPFWTQQGASFRNSITDEDIIYDLDDDEEVADYLPFVIGDTAHTPLNDCDPY